MTNRILLFALMALLCAACASNAPILGSGIAAGMVALDQMLANGTVTPEQHHALMASLQTANEGKILSPEGLTTVGGGLAALWTIIRAQRGPSTQRYGLPASKVRPA